jgi:hypothetical protein
VLLPTKSKTASSYGNDDFAVFGAWFGDLGVDEAVQSADFSITIARIVSPPGASRTTAGAEGRVGLAVTWPTAAWRCRTESPMDNSLKIFGS